MELNLEQAFQQGITAHKEGKLKDAERLYLSILKSQPNHPDANHNLGLILVSVNKSDAALPLFKIAIEANPNIDQFWLSYIDALIKEKQFDNVRKVLVKAKNQGIDDEKLTIIEAQLHTLNETVSVDSEPPPEKQLNHLLNYYQSGRFTDAEKLALSITQDFPNHPFAWKVLGILFGYFKRYIEAINANQKAILLSPQDVEAYSNLGSIFRVLGRLDEAEATYRRAIELKPDFAEAHSNLSVTLQELGKIEAAETSAIEAITLMPNLAEAHNNLGGILKQLGKLEEAEVSYNQAIVLKSDYAETHYNLGITLQKLGRLDEAEESYMQAVVLKPDYAESYCNLGLTLQGLGRLEEAEASYTKSIALKPNFLEAYNNLGGTLKQLGKLNEAEASYAKAIELSPDFAEAHNNLGDVLQELDRFDEAEASLIQAIRLMPSLANAHSNLGITLQRMGKLEKAEESYAKAIKLNPNYAENYNNLGNTLQGLSRLNESEESYIKAIELKPDYAQAYNNLGSVLQRMGKLEKAESNYNQAISLKPDYVEAMLNLSITQSYMNNLKAETVSLQNILQIDTDNHGLRASVCLAICKFLEGDFRESKKQIFAAEKIQEKTLPEFQSEKVYHGYLLKLLNWHEDKYPGVSKEKNDKNLYVIGESHCLTSHHLRIHHLGINFFCKASLIKGCKQWHLGNDYRNPFKNQFESIFLSLPKYSYVLLAIGEIDCRLSGGIIAHNNKFPNKSIKEIILTTVENYLEYIINSNSDCQHKVIIQGVPCPNIDISNHSQNDIKQLIEVINIFNYELKKLSKEKGFGFLDLYKFTDKGEGLSNSVWHVDDYHLSPEGMQEAWRIYNTE